MRGGGVDKTTVKEFELSSEEIDYLNQIKQKLHSNCSINCIICAIIQKELNGYFDPSRFELPNTELEPLQ